MAQPPRALQIDSLSPSPCPLLPQQLSALPISPLLPRKNSQSPSPAHLFHPPGWSWHKAGHLSPHTLPCHLLPPQSPLSEPAVTWAEQENHPGPPRNEQPGESGSRDRQQCLGSALCSPAHTKLGSLGFTAEQEPVQVLPHQNLRKGSKGKVLWFYGSVMLPSKGAAVYGQELQLSLPSRLWKDFLCEQDAKQGCQTALHPLCVLFPCDGCEKWKTRAAASCLHPVIFSNVIFSTSSALQLPYTPHFYLQFMFLPSHVLPGEVHSIIKMCLLLFDQNLLLN